MNKVKQFIEDNKEKYIDLLADYIRHPSVSSDTVNTPLCAQYICELMNDLGIASSVHPTSGQPVVFGEVLSPDPAAKTVLFYGHYDVQPVEPLEEWLTPPFEPSIRDNRMYGRGTADNKGQHLAHILAAYSWLKAEGSLPVNVKFLLDGEEEAGSVHLAEAVIALKDRLQADLAIVSDGAFHESGRPRTSFGNRGGFYVRVTVETATYDSHSGDKGGVIPNAAWELSRLLSTMMSADGWVTIDGFYDNLLTPTPHEEKMIDALPFDPEKLAEVAGVEKITLDKRNYFVNLMYRPWLNVNSIGCGVPSVVKGSIPSKAYANMDVRLVKNTTKEHMMDVISRHIQNNPVRGNVYLEVIGEHAMVPSKTDPEFALSRAAVRVAEDIFGLPAVEYPVSPGTLPTWVWEDLLKTPFVQIPYGNPDEHNHAPNENFDLDCYVMGIQISAGIIHAISCCE